MYFTHNIYFTHMKSFTFSDLARATGKVLDEAMKSPVALTKHGEERLVLVPAETFQRLTERHRPKAYSVDDLPPEIDRELTAALKQAIEELSEDGQ